MKQDGVVGKAESLNILLVKGVYIIKIRTQATDQDPNSVGSIINFVSGLSELGGMVKSLLSLSIVNVFLFLYFISL